MWNKLDENKRKLFALVAAVVVLYIAYRFSFSHAIAAYQLHGKLKKEASLQGSDAAYPHLNKKHLFYQQVLSGYAIKKEEVENRLWQTVSNTAVGHQVKISYDPSSSVPIDTATSQKISSQKFGFRGDYFSLVKLLDSLGKTDKIGEISTLNLYAPKTNASSSNSTALHMDLVLSLLEK